METKIIYSILILLLIALSITTIIFKIQNNKLQTEIQSIQTEYLYKIDSLSIINQQYSNIIDSITFDINNLEKQVLFLNEKKSKLEERLETFHFQNNWDDGIILLRENIWKNS